MLTNPVQCHPARTSDPLSSHFSLFSQLSRTLSSLFDKIAVNCALFSLHNGTVGRQAPISYRFRCVNGSVGRTTATYLMVNPRGHQIPYLLIFHCFHSFRGYHVRYLHKKEFDRYTTNDARLVNMANPMK